MQRTPSTPPTLDGYRVEKLIGSGGFSDVFLYEQQLPKRRVAVKVLLSHELTASARAAFVSEANLMAQLSTHPYIVTIYHAGVADDGRPFFVLEYCSRPSLSERYKKQPLSAADALRTGVRLAGAVATAHAAGILHRDIKPGNVLTNDYGWPALTDFGIASEVDAEFPVLTGGGAGDETASGGATIGMSVPWSPPEMFEDEPKPDVRSDLFSLAATIHTVLAGRTPFEVPGKPNGTLELVSRIERGELTPLARDDVPRSLMAVLTRGMSPRREDRYDSAIDFARALQRVELELGYAPTAIEVPALELEESAPAADGNETRVRAVPVIQAQGGAAAAPSTAPAPRAASGVADTRLRAPVEIAESPVVGETIVRARTSAPAETETEPGEAAPRSGGMLVGILVGVLALLTVAAVVLAVVIGGKAVGGDAAPAPTNTGESAIVGSTVPQATDGNAVPNADGTRVEFTWTNPAPTSGDVYYWARAESPAERSAVKTPSATVTGVVPGSRVCINVEIGRAGTTSEPLVICTA